MSFGRPRSTTRLQDVNILEKARNERFINTTQFSGEFNVSSSTIRRRLKGGGLQNRVPARKPALTQRHMDERLQFAVSNRNKNFDDVIFMDEKVFCSSDNGRLTLWRPDNTRYHARHVVPDRRSGRITIGFWGWMSKEGPGELVEITGRMNAKDYVEILEDSFLPSVDICYPNRRVTFMQDNSSVHNSRLVQAWLHEHRETITRIKMPAKSPDLNPIENLWGKMVQEWDTDQCRTKEQLRRHALAVWESFRGRDYCAKLVGSMQHRLRAVRNADGGYTKY